MLFFTYAERSHAVLGIPDHVPAATLIVPFFEAGINDVTHPQDTLPVITNICTGPVIVHYETWDVGGLLTAAANPEGTSWGNFTIASGETKTFSMRALINASIPATKTLLTDGPFYRGFVTFDVVTASTTLWPTHTSDTYPFSGANCLVGQIYYTRLSQGSSNGLAMVAIEATPGGTHDYLHGFYRNADYREEIDPDARHSAASLTAGGAVGLDANGKIDRIQSRLYLEPVNGATSRVVVFAFRVGASASCTHCGPGSVLWARRDGTGTIVQSGSWDLDHYVNIMDFSGSGSGWLNIVDVPADNWEIYAFSINAASPPGHPELTWDAIFESFIYNP